MMNMDGVDGGKTSMCSSVAEKRPRKQRPSGCGGIFCQLFYWNTTRISSKKRLLSSGSGRGSSMLHSSSKRFTAQPTLMLNPNVNRSFRDECKTHLQVHRNQQMKAPTLVAKLMGLDSIPATALHTKHKPKINPKPSHSQPSHFRCHKDARLEIKPPLQKQRKMQQFGMQGLAMCQQADSLGVKNVLLSSRKHHHQQHAKLIDSATKILEPGSRVTKNKANAIANYSHFVCKASSSQTGRIASAVNDSTTTQITPVQKQRMLIDGNEKLKNSTSALSKLQGQDEVSMEPLFSMNQSLSVSKAENSLQRRSLEKASSHHLIKGISYMLEKMQHHGTLSSKKLIHYKEVLRVGLLLENVVQNKSTEENELVIGHFFNQLEIIANAMSSNSLALAGFRQLQSKNKNQLIWILFDLAVEYLEASFVRNSEQWLDLQRGVSLECSVQQLILGLNYEIAKWASLRGNAANELVEWEVSHSSEILYDYDVEARNVCCELDEYLLNGLVKEIVMEAYEDNLVHNVFGSSFLIFYLGSSCY